MAGKDEQGFDYPSAEGIARDVEEVLALSGEVGSWYSYYAASGGGILIESYGEDGEVENKYRMNFTIEEEK